MLLGSFSLVLSAQQEYEFGDAPEGALAYPATGIMGSFPTCEGVSVSGVAQHQGYGAFFLTFDYELEGNGGYCPLFDTYNHDECFGDWDAGLLFPEPFTITGGVVTPCPKSLGTSLGKPCQQIIWGSSLDIQVTSYMPSMTPYYVNVVIDWNQNGSWGDTVYCPEKGFIPENVLVNLPVPNGFCSPLSLLNPPPFYSGPNHGFFWARFTISEQELPPNWTGGGTFQQGETEDYLLYIGSFDFGDAPEGTLAYPANGMTGNFPTCANTGSRGTYVSHTPGGSYFGAGVDLESDGNQDNCPTFRSYEYNNDECFQDGDAGLIVPAPFTITGTPGNELVVPCGETGTALDTVCMMVNWGSDIDILVTGTGYVNMLVDWNRDGQWNNYSGTQCAGVIVPEHVLVDFPVNQAVSVPLSTLLPPSFIAGPFVGYSWVRISITPIQVGDDWDGSGTFSDGETEDYLLLVDDADVGMQKLNNQGRIPVIVNPNPVTDLFTVEFTTQYEGFTRIDMLDMRGMIAGSFYEGYLDRGNHKISCSLDALLGDVSPGIYVVRVITDNVPVSYTKIVVLE